MSERWGAVGHTRLIIPAKKLYSAQALSRVQRPLTFGDPLICNPAFGDFQIPCRRSGGSSPLSSGIRISRREPLPLSKRRLRTSYATQPSPRFHARRGAPRRWPVARRAKPQARSAGEGIALWGDEVERIRQQRSVRGRES
jgi:hypothetical protein